MMKQTLRHKLSALVLGVAALGLSACVANNGDQVIDSSRAAQTLDEAYHVLQRGVSAHPNLGESLQAAEGVIIIPSRIRAIPFFLGISGGNGVLLMRGNDGEWSAPSFVTISDVSLGLQWGISSSEGIVPIYSRDAVFEIINNSVKWGFFGEGSLAAWGRGHDYQGITIPTFSDTDAYAISKGLYLGVALDVGQYRMDREWNQAYYNSDLATAESILVEARFSSNAGDRLRRLVKSSETESPGSRRYRNSSNNQTTDDAPAPQR